jgi:hypothetical protein
MSFSSLSQGVMAGHSPFEKRAFFLTPYVPAVRDHFFCRQSAAWTPGSRPGMTTRVMAENHS